MFDGLTTELRLALDAVGRKFQLALIIGLLVLAGLGFAAAALWTVAAAAWGPAAASAALACIFLVSAAGCALIGKIAANRDAQRAGTDRSERAASADAVVAAFRIGADIGARLSRR